MNFLIWPVFTCVGVRISYQSLVSVLAIRRTAFAVTDRRALAVRRFLGTQVKSFPLGSVNILDYQIKADGSGSIAFRAQEYTGLDASGVEKIGFPGVQDVRGAYLALINLRAYDGRRSSKDGA